MQRNETGITQLCGKEAESQRFCLPVCPLYATERFALWLVFFFFNFEVPLTEGRRTMESHCLSVSLKACTYKICS